MLICMISISEKICDSCKYQTQAASYSYAVRNFWL